MSSLTEYAEDGGVETRTEYAIRRTGLDGNTIRGIGGTDPTSLEMAQFRLASVLAWQETEEGLPADAVLVSRTVTTTTACTDWAE